MKKRKSLPAAAVNKKEAVSSYVSEIEKETLHMLEVARRTGEEMNEYYPKMLEENHSEEETEEKADSLKRATSNLTKALAHTASISDEFSARWKDIRNQKKKRKLKLIFSAPPNAVIDLSETKSEHFAKGLNLYKLLLICFIGSFAGVIVEMLWCLLTHGYFESRAGLVYGPFNLLYGVGAVALSVCLYSFRNRGSWISFLGGMLVGSVVEYVCSWGQEMLFGSRSWDYSQMPFNINGRICLLYSIFWGLLGVLWIKNIYPRMAQWILKIPNRVGKILTVALTVFFLFDALISGIAIYRWSERIEGSAPSNALWECIDERFPNERMEKIYANMIFSKQN